MAISAMPWGLDHCAGSCGGLSNLSRGEIIAASPVVNGRLRQLAERYILTMNLRNVDTDGLDAVIKMVSSLKGQTCPHSQNQF